MTHLYIELNTGLTEEVNSSIISKLYELAISGDLDNTSDLKGRLHSSVARDVEVAYLNEHFTDLHITADALYLSFVDPEVERVLAAKYGDGTGVTNINMAGITEINSYTGFSSNTAITSFSELSNFNNIVRLGALAFTSCSNLTTIDLTNILYIGGECFNYCSSLTGVINLPNVIQIGDTNRAKSFQGCGITLINIGSSFNNSTDYMYGAFNDCANLQSVTGLSGITSICDYMFNGCTSLTSVDIDWTKITTIGKSAFHNCSSLLLYTGNVVYGNISCFDGCTNMEWPAQVTLMSNPGHRCFHSCKLNKVVIDLSVTALCNTCFVGNKLLTEITGLENITNLGDFAFEGCINLEGTLNLSNVVGNTFVNALNNNLQCSGAGIFKDCQKVAKIVLGSLPNIEVPSDRTPFRNNYLLKVVDITSLDHITVANGRSLFTNCPQLHSFILRSQTVIPLYAPDNDTSTFAIDRISGNNTTIKIYVPDALVNDYKASSKWADISSYIYPLSLFATDHPDGIT